MKIKPTHPLGEILSKKLLGIETVPIIEQKRMLSRAIKAAVNWHEHQTLPIKGFLIVSEQSINDLLEYIESHSDDIRGKINDFGELKRIYNELIGEKNEILP